MVFMTEKLKEHKMNFTWLSQVSKYGRHMLLFSFSEVFPLPEYNATYNTYRISTLRSAAFDFLYMYIQNIYIDICMHVLSKTRRTRGSKGPSIGKVCYVPTKIIRWISKLRSFAGQSWLCNIFRCVSYLVCTISRYVKRKLTTLSFFI